MAKTKQIVDIRKTLLEAGAKNLREFGYPSAKAEDLIRVPLFRAFFESMLEENLGKNPAADVEINKLLSEIKEAEKTEA